MIRLVPIRGARYGIADRYLRISVNFCGYGLDMDIIFYNPTDTDSESLTANLHDKLRHIALYHYADCRLHYAVFSYSHWLLVIVATRL